ncbi:hypothetical protein MMC14_006674 [Varicellaria rhodocarpa]|nr:hypothetical protein [Varicellaria rhodocarpa]
MKLYPSIPPHLAEFALAQPIFFTGSAPTYGAHVNLSPKGLPAATFSIINPNLCAYIDSTGSGAETIAHIYENGRVTIMFCSFGLSPMIMRLFCKGKVVEWDQPEFAEWTRRMRKPIDDDGHGAFKGARAIIALEAQSSCGFGVPRLPECTQSSSPTSSVSEIEDPTNTVSQSEGMQSAFGDRKTLEQWSVKMTSNNKMRGYQAQNNGSSLDGLPGLKAARRDRGERFLWVGDAKAWWRKVVLGGWEGVLLGMVMGLFMSFLMGMVTTTRRIQ